MPYYRIEYMEEDLKEFLEAKQKAQDGENSKVDYETMMRQQESSLKRNMPKMPKMPSFKMPQMPKMPKI